MRRQTGWLVGLSFAMLAATTGCRGKIVQCNRLIEAINAQQGAIVAGAGRIAGGDPAQFDSLAGTLDTAATAVNGVQLTDAQLSAMAREYASQLTRASADVRSMAAALRAQNAAAAMQGAQAIQALGTQSDALVNRVNTYCHAP
jgi:hypothetical protein